MESKNYNKLVNMEKKRSRLTEIEKINLEGEGGREGQNTGGAGRQTQTTGCKTDYKDVLYNRRNIVNIL